MEEEAARAVLTSAAAGSTSSAAGSTSSAAGLTSSTSATSSASAARSASSAPDNVRQAPETDAQNNAATKDATEKEKVVNWRESPFYISELFSRLPDKKAKCNTCQAILKTTDGNTEGLKNHIIRKHPKKVPEFEECKNKVLKKREDIKAERNSLKRSAGKSLEVETRIKQAKLQSKDGKLSVNLPPPNLETQKLWDNAVVDWIVDKQLPFSAASGECFEKMVNVLNKHSRNRIKVKSRKTLTKHTEARAEEILTEICCVISAIREDMRSCSFTTDIWTSRSMDSYISLTVHFIDRDWILHR